MGTTLRLVVEAPTRTQAFAAGERAVAAVVTAEDRLSTWTPESELSRFNESPAGEPFETSPALARDLEAALGCAEATGGSFSPGMGRLVRAWGLREGGRRPDAAEIARGVAASSSEHLRLDDGRATRLDPDFIVEEGGFGKGVGLDDAVDELSDGGATGALLDLGGQVIVWGDAAATVSIADPRDRGREILRLDVDRGSVATSGNSERGIVVDGRRLGHLLDPGTGRPAPDFGSVTVWAARGVEADCLATGLYVLGPSAAADWAAGRHDVAVVIVERSGDGLVARASERWRGRLHPIAKDLELRWIGGSIQTNAR